MAILEKTFLWVLYSSLTASVITLLILFIKKLFNNKLSPRLHHALWFLVLIRLLLPFVPESNLSLFNLSINNHKSLTISSPLEPIYLDQGQTDENNSELDDMNQNKVNQSIYSKENPLKYKNQSLSSDKEDNVLQKIIRIYSYIWLLGFLSACIFILLTFLGFKKKAGFFKNINHPAAISTLNICKERLDVNKNIPVYCGNTFKTPFIYGLLNPKIYLPKDILDTIDDNQLLHICLHELAHYKRKDLFYNLLGIATITIHWFNPVVWIAMKKMKADRELACDSYVLEILGENESISYGMTIIKLSQIVSNKSSKKILFTHFYENKNQIERRITMIKMFKKGSYRVSIVAVILLVILGTTTLTNAKGSEVKINTNKVDPQGLIEKKDKKFVLDGPTNKFFNSLDRAKDFIDFEFKVPDFIPVGYNFDRVILDKDDIVNISFRNENKKSSFILLISQENIIENFKAKKDAKKDNKNINHNIDINPMTISNVNVSHVISKMWTDDIDSTEFINKYFIWKDEDVWYGIRYCFESKNSKGKSYLNYSHIEDDLGKIITSLKYPKDIQNISYISENSVSEHIDIYDEKDLKKAEKIIGFVPKFPLSLPGNFVPVSSHTSVSMYKGQDKSSTQITTTFNLKDQDNIIPAIEFEQTKNTFYYNNLEQKRYVEIKHPDTNKTVNIKVDSLIIDNIKVFKYETEFNLEDDIDELHQYYIWKQEDIVYTAKFIGKMDNKQEIVRALIKAD
ncbi:M56 family metallopeptidase [Tissierella sp. MSJ-40]|uniref:M56 family metallopeptidase n=1 Tax=Tissierella simiarum TaxID=2841534 RepID=A0ABS6E5B1_9FIRM|nr:M56 family metallopeptidase [Tissierella simiarum]MBU5438103.1 M56 family metallopeptidase [Tissierella simiarum]